MVKPEMTGCLSGSTITVRGEEAEWKRKGGLSRVTWHLHVGSRLLSSSRRNCQRPVLPSLSHGHMLKNQLVEPGSNHLQMNQSLNTKRKEKPSNQLILGQMLTNIGGPSTGKLEKWFGRCTNLGVLEVNGDSLFVEKKSL